MFPKSNKFVVKQEDASVSITLYGDGARCVTDAVIEFLKSCCGGSIGESVLFPSCFVNEGNKTESEEKGLETDEKLSAAAYRDNMNVVLREDLKGVFEKFGTMKYIDFKIGAESGYIRFEEAEAAPKARAAAFLSEKGGLVVKKYILLL